MTIRRYKEIYGPPVNSLTDEEIQKHIVMTAQIARKFIKLAMTGKLTMPKEYEHDN